MKKLFVLVSLLILGLGSAFAGVIGTTDPTQFDDSVDWCQFGCTGASLASPQGWMSAGGNTGSVGLDMQNFYNLQQGNGWNGVFPAGMGLVYNGAYFGNTPADISATFDNSVVGVGAYVEPNYFGPYTATITLFDQNYLSIGSFTTTADTSSGSALFIGAFGDVPVYAATFQVLDGAGREDFAIGTMKTASSIPTTPEPASLMLLASGLGMAGVIRRKLSA